jgi:putative protease
MMKKIELLAPAGSFESLMAAIHAGADAVYFGVEQLNMRAKSINSFKVEDLPEISAICRTHHVRTCASHSIPSCMIMTCNSFGPSYRK